MSPDSRSALQSRSASLHNSLHGTPVGFRGQTIRANVAAIAISFDLESGGLRQGGQFSIRFLAADLTTPPKRGEAVGLLGRTYLVSDIQQNPPAGQYIATLTPGSAQ